MELLGEGVGLAQMYAAAEYFTLLDIGCSGGLDQPWRLLDSRLRAFAFDPNIAECERLQRNERNPNVHYIGAFVTPTQDRSAAAAASGVHVHRNPWNRLAVQATSELRKARRPRPSDREILEDNLWEDAALADAAHAVYLPDFLRERGVDDIDFIKIDVDGADFQILKSLRAELARPSLLGVAMEVNWIGSDDPEDHSFHNTDRFMRGLGFDLFGVTTRSYPMSALPLRYLYGMPAEAVAGRPLQGDAVYLRDLASPDQRNHGLSPSKLFKLIVLFDMFGLPDCAAEMALVYRDILGGDATIRPILDHLVKAAGVTFERPLSYPEYIQRFMADDPRFYNALHDPGPERAVHREMESRAPETVGSRIALVRDLFRMLAGK